MVAFTLVPLILSASFTPAFTERAVGPQGALRLGVGTLSLPLQGELRLAARGYALSRRAELGLPATSDLGAAVAFGTRFGASFRLPQQVDGIEVYGAEVVVTIDSSRRVTQVASNLAPYRKSVLDWRMTPAEALALAAREVPLSLVQAGGAPYGGTRRQLFEVGDEVHSGYLAYVPSVDLRQNWLLAIDATTHALLWGQNRVFHAADDAQVYLASPGGLDAGVGRTPTSPVKLEHADGGSMLLPNDGGFLEGDLLESFGCCPNQGCSTGADAGPKRADGGLKYGNFTVLYDVVECDRVQRASNDPASNPDASFVYPPVDPPWLLDGGAVGPVAQADLADSDPFSEVQAFYQVNAVYDFVKALSSAAAPVFPANVPAIGEFKTRDAQLAPAKRTAVWSNVTIPDYNDLYANISIVGCATGGPCTTHTDRLARVDNAAYMAKENFQQLVLPDYMLDVDTLMIFQGERADWGYDSAVLWHEFGHGVIYATAKFNSFTIDGRSGNNEGGAMHEGIADYLAGAFGQNPKMGEYVGPRIAQGNSGQLAQEMPLRNLENTFACPDVLWGEVHQDSQHFSAALWEARELHFLGNDSGRTFDAAVYASLVSMTSDMGFEAAAAVIAAHLPAAFPGVQADQTMKAIFDSRGVTHCSKVVDVTGATGARPYYGIGGRDEAGLAIGSMVPGPYQMKVSLPKGARSLNVTAAIQADPLGQSQTSAELLVKVGQPITFNRASSVVTNDADVTAGAVAAGSSLSAQAMIDVPCGADLFFTLATTGAQGEVLQDVAVDVIKAVSCAPDAGIDAGTDAGAVDAGAPVSIPSIAEEGRAGAGRAPEGCGCGASGGGLALAAAGLAAALARRRRQAPSVHPERRRGPRS